MKFFLADSQDLVDPNFDFLLETWGEGRVRHRDDRYAHEVFATPAYDGVLVSKGIVDGAGGGPTRFTLAQRHRLLRVGAREFYRANRKDQLALPIMGDCGAFTYVREDVPPFSVDDVIDFYIECGFDLGISVDHVILGFQAAWDLPGRESEVPSGLRARQAITLEYAEKFLARHRAEKLPFEPLGVAQGWSPLSYAASVRALQDMGYDYVALGGMVPLKTRDILACLEAISAVRRPETRLHLLGVTRVEQMTDFASFGVASFDSTSPLRQAFKDDRDNYWTLDRTYTAIRVPQVEGNPDLSRRIRAGQISQAKARAAEQRCLDVLRRYDGDTESLEVVLSALKDYQAIYDAGRDRTEQYREILADRPWKSCPCDVCQRIGHHVVLFRGAERNRRRGFHNVWVFYRRLLRELAMGSDERRARTVAHDSVSYPQLPLFR
jgi:hypothetical protein